MSPENDPSTRRPVPTSSRAGRWIGAYRLLLEVGNGATGTVWAAYDTASDQLVAIKTLAEHVCADPKIREAFLEEGRITNLIRHPNVATLVEIRGSRGPLHYVMEYVDGLPLSTLIDEAERRGVEFSVTAIMEIIAQAARGVHAAHELQWPPGQPLGVVHRDISPRNLLILPDGTTKVIDFGIAKAVALFSANEALRTSTGIVKGTVRYLSPEQASSGPVDRRADIWALGAIAYRLIAGRTPYDGVDDMAILAANALARPIARLPSTEPTLVTDLVHRLLARDPEQRPRTAQAVADEIEQQILPVLRASDARPLRELTEMLLGELLTQRRTRIRKALDAARSARRSRHPLRGWLPLLIVLALLVGWQLATR